MGAPKAKKPKPKKEKPKIEDSMVSRGFKLSDLDRPTRMDIVTEANGKTLKGFRVNPNGQWIFDPARKIQLEETK